MKQTEKQYTDRAQSTAMGISRTGDKVQLLDGVPQDTKRDMECNLQTLWHNPEAWETHFVMVKL